jgi:hypothetical protein
MPAPLAIFPALGKAGALAKTLFGLGARKAAVDGASKAIAGAAAKRFAGKELLEKLGNAVVGPELLANKGLLARRLGMDVAFAGFNAATMPGDIVDKGTTFVTDLGLSGLTGINAARGVKKLKGSQTAQEIADQVGSVAGAFSSMPATDALLRLKGGGMTPYEKQMQEQDAIYRAQLEEELRRQYGLPTLDPTTVDIVLIA